MFARSIVHFPAKGDVGVAVSVGVEVSVVVGVIVAVGVGGMGAIGN